MCGLHTGEKMPADSKVDLGGRHASREVCELILIETSLAFREAARARLAWRDRHPCVRAAFYGVIPCALTLFGYIHFDFTAPLADGLGQGIGARTATGSPHWNTHWHWDGHWDGHLHWQFGLTPFCGSTAIPATVTVARTTRSS